MGFEAGGSRQDDPARTHDWTDNDPTVELGGQTCPSAPGASTLDDTPAGDTAARPTSSREASGEPFDRDFVLRDRYRIEDVIGRGGWSIVYRARDLHLDTEDEAGAPVAIKTLRPELTRSASAVARLKAEFRALRSLTGPGAVRVFDLDRDGETWFEVMELLDGQSLAGLLRDPSVQAASVGRRRDIAMSCAEALAAAHEQGLVHGDIKPGNVFVTTAGRVCLLDFGAAGDPDPDPETPVGMNLATLAYASPQVLSGSPAEARDDLFSLCCMACELLAERHPFDRVDSLEARRRGLSPAGLDALDAATARALGRGLAWDRDDRPDSVRQLLLMMRQADGDAVVAAATPAPQRRPPPLLRRPATWVVAAALLVPAAIALWLQRETEPTPGLAPDPSPALESPPPAAVEPADDPTADAVVPEPVQENAAAAPARPLAEAAPAPAQRFAFESDSVSVSRAASAAALRLRREGATLDRATVSWRIVEGSAREGRDYAGPTSGTLSFADGQATSTLFIPLLQGNPDDASFAVEVTDPRRGTDAAAMGRVTVRLLRLMPADGAAASGSTAGEASVPPPPG